MFCYFYSTMIQRQYSTFLLHYISFTFHIDTDVYTDILMGHSQATQQIKPQEAVKPNLQV